MAEVFFIFGGLSIAIQCDINQKMKEICINLSNKINTDLNSLIFIYGDSVLDIEKKINEITKENKMTILVYKCKNEICSRCGRKLTNTKIDDIVSSNNKIINTLTELNNQIENIINNLNNTKDISTANIQLKNIGIIIDRINEDIQDINNDLNIFKSNNIQNINLKLNKIDENKENKGEDLNNQIICTYNKQEEEISLLHDYNDLNIWDEENVKIYMEGKKNINGKNIEIYINDKKIEFNYKYKSNERGKIKVKFKFKNLLTNTFCMFRECSSLESIDLSLFDSTKLNNIVYMFNACSSLISIDFTGFNTTNVKDMCGLFLGCSSLKSLDLSSFNTINVKNMSWMFSGCLSLETLDLSSFNTTNVKDTSHMFLSCSSLKKENVKINESESKILNRLNNLIK